MVFRNEVGEELPSGKVIWMWIMIACYWPPQMALDNSEVPGPAGSSFLLGLVGAETFMVWH
jgi:hypothetical protein